MRLTRHLREVLAKPLVVGAQLAVLGLDVDQRDVAAPHPADALRRPS
jgi:hypothetical protein